ncbi:MAG: hypothetical protein NTV22_01990, partial [bacterium]|nr:hypothetical protein [bacterium]
MYTYGGTADVCVITGNAAPNDNGGGVAYTVLDHSDIRNNVAKGYGGGAYVCLLRNCTVTANRTGIWGGGLFAGYAWQCTIAGNVALVSGGGVAGDTYTPGTFVKCVITGNVACLMGGGMNQAGVANSAISGNRAWFGGGSAYGGVNNCTITDNRAVYGGGTYHGNIYNSIIYQNEATIDANCNQPTEIRYCCTTPYVWGTGNITNDPQLASAWHVAGTTPCGGKGSSSYVSGTDIDGEVWGTPPTIGCDEYRSGSITGAIGVAIGADTLTPPRDFNVHFTAEIAGRLTRSVWMFDDGTTITNQPWISRAWNTLGPHTITLRAFNETYPAGVATSIIVTVVEQPVQYADAANTSGAAWPYTNWVTAATNIQDAVDAAAPGSLVLVANGVYPCGGRPTPWSLATNRVVIMQNVTVRSVHGPAAAVIVGAPDPAGGDLGDRAVRGVWMDAGTLSSFTISNGHTATSGNDYFDRSGGGISAFGTIPCISNCAITGCGAANAGGGASWGTMYACTMTANHCGWGSGGSYTGAGGGTYGGLHYDCTLSDNRVSAYGRGGGAYGGTLERCLLSGNYADSGNGGGAAYATLTACTIVSNGTSKQGGGVESCTVNACTVALNRAESGGGVDYLTTANDCLLISNYASVAGGGAYFSTLNRCAVIDNVASNFGGGAAAGTINLCVIRGNRADKGGGTWNGTINNCLITDNAASGFCGGSYCRDYQSLNSCTFGG